MKVLINSLLSSGNFSGVQYAAENLLDAISDRIPAGDAVETLVSKNYNGVLSGKEGFSVKKVGFDAGNRCRRILYENTGLKRYFSAGEFDLYHSTGYVLPFFSNLPSIVTIHDLIALDFPQHCKNETAIYYGLSLPGTIARAKKIIAVSSTVKKDIIRKFGVAEEKVEVVHHGVEPIFRRVDSECCLQKVKEKYRLPDHFLLFVGNLEPKKNIVRIIEAFTRLRKNAGIREKLVIAGRAGWKYKEIGEVIRREGVERDVLFTGYIAREDLPVIYSLAELLVFPSLYEGFGLPVLEAMACQLPVLISGEGALPEIAGDIYPRANAYEVDDIARKILIYLENPGLRAENIAYGLKRSRYFSWEKAADRTLEVYRTIPCNKKKTKN